MIQSSKIFIYLIAGSKGNQKMITKLQITLFFVTVKYYADDIAFKTP